MGTTPAARRLETAVLARRRHKAPPHAAVRPSGYGHTDEGTRGTLPRRAGCAADAGRPAQPRPRLGSARSRPRRAAILFFGFEAAFPSLAGPFVADTLRSMGVPSGFKRLLSALSSPSWVSTSRKSAGSMLGFWAPAGIQQGCPLSGSIYAAASLPIVGLLRTVLSDEAIWMYADDLAIVIPDMATLEPLFKVFEVVEQVAGLRLSVAKSTLIPSGFTAPTSTGFGGCTRPTGPPGSQAGRR